MAYLVKDKDGNEVKKDGKSLFGSDFTGVVKGVDLKKRLLTITGTDETRDRDGDVIKVKGWNIENYVKNPVFLWAHDYSSVPLAAAKQIAKRNNPKRIDFVHRFPTKGLNPFADMILELYNEKVINAGSVGFIPQEWEEIKEGDPELEEEDAKSSNYYGKRFVKQELLEHSGCAVPANPNAIQDMVKTYGKRFNIPEDKQINKALEELKTIEDIKAELAESKHNVEVVEETSTVYQVPDDIEKEVEEELENIMTDDFKEFEGAVKLQDGFIQRYEGGEWVRDFEDDAFAGLVKCFNDLVGDYFSDSLKEEAESFRKRFYMLLKIGAVLSRKNKSRLEAAANNIKEVLSEAGALEDTEEDSAEQAQSKERKQKGNNEDIFNVILDSTEEEETPVKAEGEPEKVQKKPVQVKKNKTKQLVEELRKIKI